MVERGDARPNVLVYYPKAIEGDAFDGKTVLGHEAPVEIVPVGGVGALRLKLLVEGKPQPNAEITVLLPDGSQKKVKTGSEGETEKFEQNGRYGAWARYWVNAPGERDGKKYEEVRNYATLVFDAGGSTNAAPRYSTLPQAASSFGAVASDGWLYVYGGHVAKTHNYSTESVSGRFDRLKLTDEPVDAAPWETLPGGPGLQGMNLAAYNHKIYRVGGMTPRNKPGEPSATFSTADCARFDPATKEWEALPPLPEPRSSHDVVVIGGKLIVVGGWTLNGTGQTWLHSMEVLDLEANKPEWKSVAQPFQRRALIATAYEGKMYVLGGMDEKGNVVYEPSIYDPKTDTWTKGPKLPGGENNAFAPAACTHAGGLYVSVADGKLYRLSRNGDKWDEAGQASPRIAHRIASDGKQILVFGGAGKGGNLDSVEAVKVVPAP